MEPPTKIEPKGGADYLEVLTKAAFQSGVSWAVVAKDKSIIRNRRKIAATVENARTVVELEDEHGDFAAYLRAQGEFEAKSTDIVKRFKFIGDFGAFYFLYVVGEEVPEYNDWRRSRGLDSIDP